MLHFSDVSSTFLHSFQWGWVVGTLVMAVAFLLAYLLRPSLARRPIMRSLSILALMLPFLVIHAYFTAPDVSELGVYAVFFTSVVNLYDLGREWRWGIGTFTACSLLALIVQHVLRPFLKIGEKSIVVHIPFMQFAWKFLFVVWAILLLMTFIRKERFTHDLMVQQEALRVSQEKAMMDLERAKAEAEARYEEARRLQGELAREVARTTLTARYEALMRDQYGKPLSDFLRALLESLQDDLGFIAGLAYQVKDGAYEVVATYALPQYQGRTFSGGLLETATALREPYLVAASPGHAPPLPGLAKLHPRYALYLPVYADVTGGGVIAILELLFLRAPEAEKVALIGGLLPRLGSYLWMQQASLQG